MNTLESIKEWWHKVQEHSTKEKKLKAMHILERESVEALQAMEFKGDIYLCFRGVPLLKDADVTGNISGAITESRMNYIEYMTDKYL